MAASTVIGQVESGTGQRTGQSSFWRMKSTTRELSVVKAWVGEIPCAPYMSMETTAHGTMSCDCG